MPRIITITPNPTYDYSVEADFVEPNRKLRCRNPERHPGGGGLNVARAAQRLGADVLAIFTVGGLYGDALMGLVAEEQVPARAIRVKGETRLAFHVRELAHQREYRFNLPGEALLKIDIERILGAVRDEAGEGDFIVGSGSLPPGETDDFWARAAHAAKEAGANFVLDSVSGLEQALAEGVYLLRQNIHEYQTLAGRALEWPDEIEEFARHIVSKGSAKRYIITHGSDGSILASNNRTISAQAHDVGVASAVGAGDSFVGAFLVALLRGWSEQEALRYASAAAAATRMTPGTSLFQAEDVDKLYRSTN
ncbi:MAG: hexose kinase [Parvularculaceae bacterium]